MAGILLWDFDGTLAHRDGMWSGALLDAMVSHDPDGAWSIDQIRPHMSKGFPWHEPDREHFDIVDAQTWWAGPLGLFSDACVSLGMPPEMAERVAVRARENYLSLTNWRLAYGALDVLSKLSADGWTHMIVSNHVPELQQIMSGLGLSPYIGKVFCSAEMGVEKPNPKFFEQVLLAIPPGREIWVIGDSVSADISGARGAGLPSILIGSEHALASACVAGLPDIPAVLGGFEFELRPLTALPSTVAPLEAESLATGFTMIARLRSEWDSGVNRFDGRGEILLGAFRGDVLVGAAGLTCDPYHDDPSVGRLRHVYVLQRERRAGVGRALVQALLQHAPMHFGSVRLSTRHAAAFYDALGFERAEGEHVTHILRLG